MHDKIITLKNRMKFINRKPQNLHSNNQSQWETPWFPNTKSNSGADLPIPEFMQFHEKFIDSKTHWGWKLSFSVRRKVIHSVKIEALICLFYQRSCSLEYYPRSILCRSSGCSERLPLFKGKSFVGLKSESQKSRKGFQNTELNLIHINCKFMCGYIAHLNWKRRCKQNVIW